MEKECVRCHEIKPEEEFSWKGNRKSRQDFCKACFRRRIKVANNHILTRYADGNPLTFGSREGFVYLAQSPYGGEVKIGFSATPETRIKTFKYSFGVAVRLIATKPGTPFEENRIQRTVFDFHTEHEWFRPVPEVKALLESPEWTIYNPLILEGEKPMNDTDIPVTLPRHPQRLEELEAENARLKAALQPFATQWWNLLHRFPESKENFLSGVYDEIELGSVSITGGALRKAADAYGAFDKASAA